MCRCSWVDRACISPNLTYHVHQRTLSHWVDQWSSRASWVQGLTGFLIIVPRSKVSLWAPEVDSEHGKHEKYEYEHSSRYLHSIFPPSIINGCR